jgi:hypothetical protein
MVKNCFVYALDELFAKKNYMLQGFYGLALQNNLMLSTRNAARIGRPGDVQVVYSVL